MTQKLTRRFFLGTSASAFASSALAGTEQSQVLRALAAKRNCLFGSATNTVELRNPVFARVFAREAGILVPEYELKRNLVEPGPGQFDFHAGDKLRAFADAYGILFRGHTLLWHRSNPTWLEAEIRSGPRTDAITHYVQSTVTHFRGIHSWDVVNECLEPADGRVDGLRNSFWLAAFGPDYINIAFRAARNADPHAMLVLNEYGLETDTRESDRRRSAMLALLESLRARGTPIDALGLQGHLRAFGAPVDRKKLGQFLGDVRSLGLRVLVTEHDVDVSRGPSDILSRVEAAAKMSRRLLDVVLEQGVVAILTWGLSSRFRKTLLPLDAKLAQTKMYEAIAAAFSGG